MSAGPIDGGSNGQDVELNLAPILDAFTVLITFMLASASFLVVGILDAGVAAPGKEAAQDQKPPSITVTAQLRANQTIAINVKGKLQKNIEVTTLEQLIDQLKTLKGQYSDFEAITLTADNTVSYMQLTQAMDKIRKTIPVVALGGF